MFYRNGGSCNSESTRSATSRSELFMALVLQRVVQACYTGSVLRRTLSVAPVDIIQDLIHLLLNCLDFEPLSLDLYSLLLTLGSEHGLRPDCWLLGLRRFLRAPIPRVGSGSTTTTTAMVNQLSYKR